MPFNTQSLTVNIQLNIWRKKMDKFLNVLVFWVPYFVICLVIIITTNVVARSRAKKAEAIENKNDVEVNEELKNKNDVEVNMGKKELKILLILSGIGFIIGAIIGIKASVESGEIDSVFLGMWFGIGIGGALSFIVAIPYMFKTFVREKGFGEGVKAALGGILVWLAIFAVAGPIGLLIRGLRINSRIKKIRTAI
jgi:integral membrane sensor domain MASE1